ncbi:MAG: hypothetical protein ABJH08_03370 [Balneola sp.]
MKKIFILTSLFLFMCSSISAQDRNKYILDVIEYERELNDLVLRVIDSLGGKANNLQYKSYQSNGEITYPNGEKALFDLFYLEKDWARLEQKKEAEYVLFGSHGRRGWKRLLAKKGTTEETLKGTELAEEYQFNIYENNLFDYDKQRLEIYYEGEVLFGDIEAYIIRLAGFSYGEEMYYISKKTYRPIMKQVYIFHRRSQSVINYTIKDYIKIQGVLLPKLVGIEKNGSTKMMEFYTYDFSTKFDKNFFKN